MQRVATGEETVETPAAAGAPMIDLRALMRGKFRP
jgi:hypothetical protein